MFRVVVGILPSTLGVSLLAVLLGACGNLPRFWHVEPSHHVVEGHVLSTRVVDMGRGIFDVEVTPRDMPDKLGTLDDRYYVEAATAAVQQLCPGAVSLLRVFRFGEAASPIVRLSCTENL